ncbi:minor tail protein [Mycobacterium phage JF4]|uniref:Minor tail protein n=1 Tax=Mycobacterium phage MK4 TaxID=2725639 RepID=A0A6M3T3U6_9CAUD|nr:minor tail protein [Mycobacterium phage MK4]QJD52162.1 minor tail protein [Mycobacterium phage JF4]QJD52241.1 minor tail protein [Mycobacterium phage JF2]BBC53745.1 putative minor tail protein [Mycobacterium phage B1]
MDTLVELEGVNGEWFTLAGPGEGDRGVYLGTDVKGLYDPPVKVVYEEPGNWPGSRYLNHRILKRDIVFGVEIPNDAAIGPNSWLSRESEWRKAWAFDRDCKLYITTPESGTRYLKLRLAESPEVSWFTDPRGNKINRTVMVCVAGDPFWYQDDVVYTAVTQTDTTFNPNPLPWPWPKEQLPTETLTITVDPSDGKGGLNPTDQPIWLKWILPGSTEEPAEPYIPGVPWLGAPNSPAVIWTVPDYSFEDEAQANRRIRMPGLIGGLRTCEVQQISLIGNPTSGSFVLEFKGDLTSPIARNATAATVKARLEALPSIGSGNLTVAGGPTLLSPHQPWRVSFTGADFAGEPQPLITVASHTLADSDGDPNTVPNVRVDRTTEGYTAPAENAVVDTDPRVEQVSSENGSQLWARMNGVRFHNPVPPYTKSKTFEITVSGAVPGQMVVLRIPRAWTRPWGLE